jgi:hypothetical protein
MARLVLLASVPPRHIGHAYIGQKQIDLVARFLRQLRSGRHPVAHANSNVLTDTFNFAVRFLSFDICQSVAA